MKLNFKFAVASDLHIALPNTIFNRASRFHLVEVSIPAFELILEHLAQLNIDFLLIPGDLTQDGEPENHAWLSERLAELPYPVYVIPGNHDVPVLHKSDRAIGCQEFPHYYTHCGYDNPEQLYYTHQILPGVRLIGLNSNQFDTDGKQLGLGRLDEVQLNWLKDVLANAREELIFLTIHHNVIEHLPEQATNPLGRRYMLENASKLLEILKKAGVKLIFTGHLHVQDIAEQNGIYEITTGSLVSYPHPYRIIDCKTDELGRQSLEIASHFIKSVPEWPELAKQSREWLGDR
ncbi:MAG: metallophosphoesterase, partial [Okeania sp. SIO2H7]|nr:metallophosphoesterase [Okeania sp. SIO2H7]